MSVGGGGFQKWSETSRELLFLEAASRLIKGAPYVVDGESFQAGKVTTWSPTLYRPKGQEDPFALHPDGKRIAVSAAVDAATVAQDKVVFVFNFADYLNTIAPLKK